MEQMDAYIGLRSGDNINEQSDVPDDKMKIHGNTIGKKVHREIRVPKKKWVVLRYPTASMAQLANMSTEGFEDFYFDVCNLDYSKMDKAMDNLVELMNKTDKVRLAGEGTDLSFLHQGYSSSQMCRPLEYSGRGSVQCPCEGLGKRSDFLQYAITL